MKFSEADAHFNTINREQIEPNSTRIIYLDFNLYQDTVYLLFLPDRWLLHGQLQAR